MENMCESLIIFLTRRFLLLFEHPLSRLVEDVLKEHDVSLSSAESVDSSKLHVLDEILRIKSQVLDNAFESDEVVGLRGVDDVKNFIHFVCFLSLKKSGDIAGQIEGRRIAFHEDNFSISEGRY